MEFPNELIEGAVKEISRLPGIGKKTALRLALHLLKEKEETTANLTDALSRLRKDTKYCGTCHIISNTTDCTCKTISRDSSVICVVVDTPDMLAIRATGQFQGLFHVLGGIISPIAGIGPENLHIETLIKRIQDSNGEVQEVILALSATMEGDTTAFYISKKLQDTGVKVSSIARGIPMGGELEYADEVTLGRSIIKRTTYDSGHSY